MRGIWLWEGKGRKRERKGRKVEGEWKKGGGRMGERWREDGRKVEGEWEKGGGGMGDVNLQYLSTLTTSRE